MTKVFSLSRYYLMGFVTESEIVRKKIRHRQPKNAVCWHCQDVPPPKIFADMPCRHCGRKRERRDDGMCLL